MKKQLLLIVFLLLSCLYGFSQGRVLQGKVVTDDGSPLPGATITAMKANKSVITDSQGKFLLPLTQPDTLVVRYIGYHTSYIPVSPAKNPGIIALTGSSRSLNELVVTGYQKERKKDLLGAISVVNMNEVKDMPVGSPLQAMQGRVPGMYIARDGTPGGGIHSVLIRGINTLGNNDPLYIIDGQPVGSQAVEMLDPNDIESFQVLKDAASASIYGSRASNGVIIITTKSAKSNKFKVDVNSSFSSQDYYSHLNMLNTEQRGRVLWQAAINDGTDPNVNTQYTYLWHRDAQGNPVLDNMKVNEWLNKNIQGGIKAGNTNWFKEISQPGYLIRNNVSISSGSSTNNLFLSLGHLYNQGVVKYTNYEQFTFRINSSLNSLNKRIKVGEDLQIVSGTQTPIGSGQGGTTLDLAVLDLPILPVYAEDGSFAGPVGSGFSNRMNALEVAELSKNWKNHDKSAYGTIYLELSPITNLIFKSSMGIDYGLTQDIIINPTFQSGILSLPINNYSNNIRQNFNWTWDNTLNYHHEMGEHKLTILAGMEAITDKTSFLDGYKEGFLLQTPNYFQIDAGTGLSSLSGNESGYQLLSYFSKVNYSYKSKYLASITLRADGSSRFGQNNKFGFFPALSVGWRISDENFMKNNFGFISQLMLRGGMGHTGNQKIADNARFGLFIPGYGLLSGRHNLGSAYDLNGAHSGTLPSGVIQTQTANPNLKWETTNEINIGTDFGFLDQKITGSFDYFVRNTYNILILPPHLAVLGEGGTLWENGATMKNKGWEFVLGYDNHQIGDFSYQVSASVGSFKDEVTYLPASVVSAYPGNAKKTIIGHSLSAMFGYVADGIFQNQKEVDNSAVQPGKDVGRIRYKDLNGDGVINVMDQTWLGNSLPDFEFGLNTVLGYKKFSLSFFLQGVQGIMEYNSEKNQATFLGAFAGQNNTTLILNAWTPQHPNTDIPAVSNFDSNDEERTSSYQIENGSYIKLRNIQLGYTLPKRIQQSLKMNSAEVYISGSQLFTIKTKDFTSPDPENPGSFYPISRSFTIGIHASF